ncbi:MAG: amidohydrolase family protein [Parvibaculaceae bacterium]
MTAHIRVDTHIHLYQSADIGLREKQSEIWEYGGKPARLSTAAGTVDELLAQMERAAISKGIVLIYTRAREARERAIGALPRGLDARARAEKTMEIDAAVLRELEWNNLWGCKIAADHPQLSTFVAVDLSVQSAAEAERHVRTLAEDHGARGVKLHTGLQGFSMSDERLWPLYALCEARGLSVLGHGGPDREGNGYCVPQAFAPMLAAFPKLTVVMAHMGGASWRETAAVAARHPNLCLDCSEIIEWTGSPNGPTEHELAGLIRTVGYERVMMGSDFPWYDLDRTVERVMGLPLLSLSEKEAIVGANAVRLLRL